MALIKASERPQIIERQKLSLDRFFLLKGWAIFLNKLLSCFAWGTIGPFVVQYGKELNIRNAGIFFLFWAGGIIVSCVFGGKLVDRGKIHEVNVSAMAIVAISFLVFALVHNIYAFCISGLFIGFDFGLASGMLVGGYITGFFSFQVLYLVAAAMCGVSAIIYWCSSCIIFEKKD